MLIAPKTAQQLAPHYDAIVVGSGYGGGVAASRLARMGFRVALLEQGRLWRPGDFPTTINARRKALRVSGRRVKLGDPTGLYRLTAGKGLSVLAATGVGGGSLINAGVTLPPSLGRLRSVGWPDAVVSDGLFEDGLSRAETMFGVAKAPDPERFGKYNGMCRASEAVGTSLGTPAMTIAHEPRSNAVGVVQYACRYCGDCWSGCNVGAKTTVGITYVTDAVDHGAEVFCTCRVDVIEKVSKGDNAQWSIDVADLSNGGKTHRTTSQILVLAAGTLGTNELLLRAQRRGLPLPRMLGEKFSANGDDLVFATELDQPIHAVATGFPPQAPPGTPMIGPHSMALFNLGTDQDPVWIHDGTMMTVMAKLAPIKALFQGQFARAWRLVKGGIYGEEQSRTQIFYIVAQDDARGRLRLHNDHVYVDWPEYSDSPARLDAEQRARDMIERMGGVFQTNPLAMTAFGGNRVIAHPLGGCAMGETAQDGVVAPDGRVFDPSQGPTAIHEGLYVCDGAAIPTSVGVSPLLTISALAERVMMLASKRLGRPLNVETNAHFPPRDASM